jgi:hypothetical protein
MQALIEVRTKSTTLVNCMVAHFMGYHQSFIFGNNQHAQTHNILSVLFTASSQLPTNYSTVLGFWLTRLSHPPRPT